MRLASSIANVILLYPLAGCGGPTPDDRAVHRDSAGVDIVISSATDRQLAWRFEPDFELGGAEEGPESFYRVRQGLVDVDGNNKLYILNPAQARVTVFDSSGHHQWTAGSSGGGPGEMLSPNSLSVSSDGVVYVHDSQKMTLVVFDTMGVQLPQIDFPFGLIRASAPHFHIVSGGMAVLARAPFQGSDYRPIDLLRIENQDTVILLTRDLSISRTATYPSCGITLTLPTLFAPVFRWDRRQNRLAVASGPEYRVEIYDGPTLVRILQRSIEPESVTQAQALEVLGRSGGVAGPLGSCGISAIERLQNHGYASQVQIVQGVTIAPDGGVWIRRGVGLEGSLGPIDVFDAAGEYVGSLPAERPFPIIFLPDGRVGYQRTDEFEVERLVIARIIR